MEDNRIVRSIILCFLLVVLLPPSFVFAYSEKTTHPALTDEIVDFYNLSFPNSKLNNSEKELVVQGSIDEDAFGRWMRHFYDPIYNRGVNYLGRWQSSKEWAQDHKAQAKLDLKMTLLAAVVKPFDGSTDYSWERSIYEYAWGDKSRGLLGLGHALHLIEDATVPDHTRDDPHPPFFGEGSPYEDWTRRFDRANLDMISNLGGQQPIILGSLAGYFDIVAGYSNSNFFSKDTVLSKEYVRPKIVRESVESVDGKNYRFGYGVDETGVQYRLVKIEKNFGDEELHYSIEDRGALILTDYWSLLSKQAVLHGAGVVRLFFDEVEKEKKNKKLLAYNQSPPAKVVSSVVTTFLSPTLRQAQTDPELAADLGLPKPPPPEAAVLAVLADVDAVGGPADDKIDRTNNTDKTEETKITAPPPVAPPPKPPPESLRAKAASAVPVASASGGGGGGYTPPPGESRANQQSNQQSSQTQTAVAASTETESESSATSTDSSTTEEDSTASSTPEDDSASSSTPPSDTDAPDISYTVSACASSVASNGCLLYSGSNLAVSWSSTASDIASYTIECTLSGANCSGFPLTDTTSTSTTANLSSSGLYTLTFKAQDAAGNIGTATTQIEINPQPVVINELAWMGTAADETDEWIELFNTSSFDIVLGDGSGAVSDWTIIATDNSPSITLNGTIRSGSFFVLERTNSDSTSYAEDQIFTGAINDPFGDDITLYNPVGTAIDATPLRSAVSGSIGTKTPTRKTAERINPYYAATDSTSNVYNWRTASTTGSSITDANGAAILGTPGAENSVYNPTWRPVYISDSTVINNNTTWSSALGPYIVQANQNQAAQVAEGATLTLEPGVKVMMITGSTPALNVYGTLRAEGTALSNIVFTSYSDSDYGGPGGATKGIWSRIYFGSNSLNSLLQYTKFRYGGFYIGSAIKPVLEPLANTALTVDNSVFEYTKDNVIDVSGSGFSNLVIQNSTFSNNGGSSNNSSYGVIRAVSGAAPVISGNTFSSNSISPITISGTYSSAYPNIGSNTAASNTYNTIFVGATSVFSLDINWSGALPYFLDNTTSQRPTVSAGATLTIEPGVVLKSISGIREALRIDGVLNWAATEASPGVLTSLKDDAYGGDTNNNGSANSPAAGDWSRIRFTNTTTASTLSNIKLRYGVSGSEVLIDSGALVDQTNVVIEP
ncbi:MAG: lamin tail domain-containing protein [Parcubacteria group bacterium]|nr:lamin tail domain-containing protein [Parcubacteria group bacterium]